MEDNPLSKIDFLEGTILLVNKPLRWTSFDVVNKIRYRLRNLYKIKNIKVGHGGTLDPMATGLIIIATGKMTKQLQSFLDMQKAYTGTFFLGATTPSYDSETEPDEYFETDHITTEMIEAARQKFMGVQYQVPPMFSAIKVDGQPLYIKAREGQKLEIEPRKVEIFDFKLDRIDLPEIDFDVSCSKGTYIRSLAYDFGKALGSGAYLKSLVRTRSGEFLLKDAWELEDLIAKLQELENRGIST